MPTQDAPCLFEYVKKRHCENKLTTVDIEHVINLATF